MTDHRSRRATGADRDVLNEMTLAGVRYWGHDIEHPDAYAGLVAELAADDDPGAHPVLPPSD